MNITSLTRIAIVLLISLSIFFVFTTTVSAHIPYFSSAENSSLNRPFEIKDIQISKVIYQKLKEEQVSSWIKFEAREGEILNLEIGLPKITQLFSYRPKIILYRAPYVLTNDISKDNLEPILYISTSDITSVKEFHEPFTKTNSWILYETSTVLPNSGTYFIESLNANSTSGKLWIAIGKEEKFGAKEIADLPFSIKKVREFHKEDLIPGNIEIEEDTQINEFEKSYVLSIALVIIVFLGFRHPPIVLGSDNLVSRVKSRFMIWRI